MATETKIEVRDRRNGDWYWIQRSVYETHARKIGVIGLALYNAYSSYARDSGEAWPSIQRISDELGIGERTVRKYNAVLQKHGLIEIESGKENGAPNKVWLTKIPVEKLVDKPGEGRHVVPTPSARGADPGRHVVPTKEKHSNEKQRKRTGILKTDPKRYDDWRDSMRPVLEKVSKVL